MFSSRTTLPLHLSFNSGRDRIIYRCSNDIGGIRLIINSAAGQIIEYLTPMTDSLEGSQKAAGQQDYTWYYLRYIIVHRL